MISNINNFLIVFFLQLFFYQTVYSNTLESDSLQVYFSKSYSYSYSKKTQSIAANNSSNTIKWFDDYSNLSVGQRSELGIFNNSSNYSFSFRNQTIHGRHFGTTAKYTCLGFFCSWIDYSIIGDLDSNDSITYDIQFFQFTGKRAIKNDVFIFSPLIGINFINYDLIVSNSSNSVINSSILPLPFIGYNFKLLLPNEFEVIYDIHFANIDHDSMHLKFHDSEFEIRYKISKYFHLGVGNNKLFFNFKRTSDNITTDLKIPVHSTFVKVTFLY